MPRKFVDLSIFLENDVLSDPPAFAPKIQYFTHENTFSQIEPFFPGLKKEDLPDGEGWAVELVQLSTHNGTHLDAPYHFHSTMDAALGERRASTTIDAVPLDWCFQPGVRLDFRHLPDGHVVGAAEVEAELARTREQLHEVESENLQRRAMRSRPEVLRGTTRRVDSPLGTMYVNITEDDRGQPFEVFISLGKAGGALMADVEAIGRLISLALRSGVPLQAIYRQLRDISSDRITGLGPNKVKSVPDAIAVAFERWDQEKKGIQQELLPGVADVPVAERVAQSGGEMLERQSTGQDFIGACPDCGSQLAFVEGCAKCHVCGYSECG
ncbi:MAG TPA: cyclase family protein [Vicinamibacteria bacterium]